MLVLALSCPATVKEKFLTCWTAGPELLPAFFRSPVILGIPAMVLKTNNMKEGRQYGSQYFNCLFNDLVSGSSDLEFLPKSTF